MPINPTNPEANPAGVEVGYDQIAANASILSTSSSTPTPIIAGQTHIFDGTACLFHFFCNSLVPPSTTGGSVNILLLQDGTSQGVIANVVNDITGGQGDYPVVGEVRLTPTAGAHIAAYCSATTGTPLIQAGAGGAGNNVAAFLRITKC